MNALVVVDVQYDFLNGGSLAVADSDSIIDVINKIRDRFDITIFTQDYHPANHCSFTINGGIWPVHCVESTHGSDIHSNLLRENDIIIKKGVDSTVDSYSGFFDNERKRKTELDYVLKSFNVDSVYICGLATDYCVKYTAIDAVKEGYKTYLIKNACKGVNINDGDVDRAKEEMINNGVIILGF